jgi:site-specific recombinase XerD
MVGSGQEVIPPEKCLPGGPPPFSFLVLLHSRQAEDKKMITDTTTSLVLNTVDSNETRRAYSRALTDFSTWRLFHGADFTRSSVLMYRSELLSSGMGGKNINGRLTAVRRLAAELVDSGQLDPVTGAGIQRVQGVKAEGVRLGNWLSREDAQALLSRPDTTMQKGLRDRAILAILVGCGLRREECANLTFAHIQQREGRWVVVDLIGKRNKTRSIPMPSWCKAALDAWAAAAGITEGVIFRSIHKGGKVGQGMTAQAIYSIVKMYCPSVACHDLRRTFAKLAYQGGSPLEQIQLSLGHASSKTTEIYLGLSQSMTDAPCDRLGLELEG